MKDIPSKYIFGWKFNTDDKPIDQKPREATQGLHELDPGTDTTVPVLHMDSVPLVIAKVARHSLRLHQPRYKNCFAPDEDNLRGYWGKHSAIWRIWILGAAKASKLETQRMAIGTLEHSARLVGHDTRVFVIPRIYFKYSRYMRVLSLWLWSPHFTEYGLCTNRGVDSNLIETVITRLKNTVEVVDLGEASYSKIWCDE